MKVYRKKMSIVLVCVIVFFTNVDPATALDPNNIPKGYFTDVKVIAELAGDYIDFSPAISYDGLTLFFIGHKSTMRPGTVGKDDIWMATRNSKNEPFGNVTNVTELNSVSDDNSITPCPDNLMIIFSSKRSGKFLFYQATREHPDEPFGNIVPIDEINEEYDGWHASVSGDGLQLVFCTESRPGFGDFDIWISTRQGIDQPWGSPVNLGSNVNSEYIEWTPSISFFASLE